MFFSRSDGRRIRSLPAMQKIMPYIMRTRTGSVNFFREALDCAPLEAYIAAHNGADAQSRLGVMHILIAALVRTIALRPQLNRFVVHSRIYARRGISVSFVVHRSLRVEDGGTTIKLEFTGTEDLPTIARAVNAAVLVCEMAANYKAQGLTLLDKLEQLREEFGFYAQRLLTFQYEGESGAAKMADIMRKLRAPLDTFQDAHFPTATRIDYQNDETGLPKSDVLSFALADGSKIIVRPSGTEPKLKAYLFARGENQAAAEKVLDELETLMNGYCKE